jgi:hypothetical protein
VFERESIQKPWSMRKIRGKKEGEKEAWKA